MRKVFLKKARETLEAMRTQLLKNVQAELHEGRDRAKDEAIDEASSRVEDGSYGLCEDCGAEVAEGRLQALPFTRLCVTCQSDREREPRMNKRYEADPTFRRLGVGDDGDSET